MSRMFSRELIGMEVGTSTGRSVGILEDIVIDTDGGYVKYMLISAAGNTSADSCGADGKGRFAVETDRIRVSGDRLIID
ncbi:MAG: PRC-barrel domain-containing protein [Candidatus Methanoplasma sp.]|jgi:sporulation protein YlmC with PRC-barrel domain|nr:PRC-barrel domain-containing protein [Candidatus Methanoplasma sp.]